MLGDEVLRRRAEEVDDFSADLKDLVDDLWSTMYHADGVGLAAPQIGVSERVLVVDVRDEENPGRVALINPVIVEASPETEKGPEGCLSIPGLEDVVIRASTVRVEARDADGQPVSLVASGLFARALQHEIDHLDGILFLDRVSPLKRKMLLAKWRKSREELKV